MKSESRWETKSLEWIHQVREEIDGEIQKKGLSPAQWIKERGVVDVERLSKSLGLDNVKVAQEKRKVISNVKLFF